MYPIRYVTVQLHNTPLTDEGVAVGSGTATGMTPMTHRVAGRASVPVIVIIDRR
jgi:hypothetical protein